MLPAFETEHDIIDRKQRYEFGIVIVTRHEKFGGETATVCVKPPGKARAGIATEQPAAFGSKHHAVARALHGLEGKLVKALQHVVRPIQ